MEQSLGTLRIEFEQLIHINSEVTDILLKTTDAYGGVFHKVTFAELHESAERLQHGKTATHSLTGETVKHGVNTGTTGILHNFITEIETAGIVGMLYPHHSEEITLFSRTCRSINLKT